MIGVQCCDKTHETGQILKGIHGWLTPVISALSVCNEQSKKNNSILITMSASASTHLSRNKLWNHWDDGAIMEPCLWNPVYLSPRFQSIPEMSNSRAVIGVLHQEIFVKEKISLYVYMQNLVGLCLQVMFVVSPAISGDTIRHRWQVVTLESLKSRGNSCRRRHIVSPPFAGDESCLLYLRNRFIAFLHTLNKL